VYHVFADKYHMQAATQYSPELEQLLEHIKHIPANDELELRVAVHDLQQYTQQSAVTLKKEHGYHVILETCAQMIQKSDMQAGKQTAYMRSLHAFLYNLLPEILEPQSQLDLHALQLHGCQLAHIEISNSKLQYMDVSSSDLSHANLHHSDLSHSNMMSANLAHSDLYACCLNHSDLSWADLSYADVHRIQAINAHMSGAILSHTNASYALFSGSDLSSTELSHSDFSFSNLFAVNLHRSKLHGTDLRGTGITAQRLSDADMDVQSNDSTLWGDESDCGGRNPLHAKYYHTTVRRK
ncbi:MAG: pentapeptide repeat-containing protein, partial [Mariprofundaceae bacterium]|nr:pentapeptide repeat-containing protein [Mariprofundaceae bacterium]